MPWLEVSHQAELSVQYRHKKRNIALVSSTGVPAFGLFARTRVLEKMNVKT